MVFIWQNTTIIWCITALDVLNESAFAMFYDRSGIRMQRAHIRRRAFCRYRNSTSHLCDPHCHTNFSNFKLRAFNRSRSVVVNLIRKQNLEIVQWWSRDSRWQRTLLYSFQVILDSDVRVQRKMSKRRSVQFISKDPQLHIVFRGAGRNVQRSRSYGSRDDLAWTVELCWVPWK